ncbi:ras-related protein Rap-1b-like [Mytilus galloprovincialis]|uniref:ras-related protein Rap-1b-like n=1 Tax=Mytilus galloprovincialis TaxID=29158 RepID=UPI003F7C8905
MTEQCPRFQIAFLGAGRVGKTSILRRYLFGTFFEEYLETVEETYSQPYYINGKRQNIDYIDTAGSISFPAMQQIYMSQANAFVLVYAIDDKRSFDEMKNIWEKIKQARNNVLNIPVVIVGNNLDMENNRQIETFDALNWAFGENLGGCFLEVSAKTDQHIKDIFEILLEQLGNTRSEQKGPFRIRSTSLSRKPSDSTDLRQNLKTRKCMFKKSQTTERLNPSDKHFQDSVFDDFKQMTIKRIHQTLRGRKCFPSEDHTSSWFCQTLETSKAGKIVDQKKHLFHGNKNIHADMREKGMQSHLNLAKNSQINVRARFSNIFSGLVRKHFNKRLER